MLSVSDMWLACVSTCDSKCGCIQCALVFVTQCLCVGGNECTGDSQVSPRVMSVVCKYMAESIRRCVNVGCGVRVGVGCGHGRLCQGIML